MASAQVEQQQQQPLPQQPQAPAEAETKQEQPGPAKLQQEGERAEPGKEIGSFQGSVKAPSAQEPPADESQTTKRPSESGESAKAEDAQPVSQNQEPQDTRLQVRSSEERDASAPPQQGASKSPESAQLRARRLAIEAAEAQEDAQQAAKRAAEKQIQALAAAKEAVEEIHAEHEAAKAAALHEVEEVSERASKQQKMSPESSQEALQELLQNTLESSLRQASEQKGASGHHSNQPSNGAEVSKEQNTTGEGVDAFQTTAKQFAVEASQTLQHMMQTTVEKTVAEMSSPKREREGQAPLNVEQPMNPAQYSELPTGPETPTQAGPAMPTQAPAAVLMQPPADTNGTQGHTLDPNAILIQNPFSNTTVAPGNTGLDSFQNPASNFMGKDTETDTYRITPESQPTEQGPAPMQVG